MAARSALCLTAAALLVLARSAAALAQSPPAPAAAPPTLLNFLLPPAAPAPPAEKKEADKEKTKAVGAEGEKEKTPTVESEADRGWPRNRDTWFNAHAQGTIVTQDHPPFHSPYVGPNSFEPVESAATTATATLYLTARLWRGGEMVFDPEMSGGTGLSETTGIAGFPNGEATRVGALEPTPYIARLFFRQTWGLDGAWEKLEDAPNQLPGPRDINHITVVVGKLAAPDLTDNNRYSHDPRTQFFNWSIMDNGAWDYPANVRGYTYGVGLEFNTMYLALRYGIWAEPREANGSEFDPRFLKANGQILEFEERWGLGDRPGKLREWVFANHAHMGNYEQALEAMPVDPDVTQTRAYRFKYGFGLNLEQELTRELGVFSKVGWNDGHSESWAFTEIDRTAVLGLLLKGRCWHRPHDEVGLAAVINGLSEPHRNYLRAGGLGFIIGDGRLNYAPEQILETYYNWRIRQGIFVTFDFQGVNHPAYNADRGPVAIGAIRVHFEF